MQPNDIINNLNIISEKLFKSVEGQVYEVLDKITVITPDILRTEPLKNIVSTDRINGMIIIANSFILFYICYYIFTQLISMYNGRKIENVYLFIIKIVVIYIIVNNSYYICEIILDLFEKFSYSIDLFTQELSNEKINFNSLKEDIVSIEDFMKTDLFSLNGIIKGVISFGMLTILINFSIRYVTIIFLIVISPFAIMTASSKISSGFFKTWIKLLLTNMFTQIIVKLLLIVPIVYKSTDSVMYKIILVGTIYLLYRITTFTKELFTKISEENESANIFNK
ncbi:MAG: hypothetical protein N2749_06390 [Clostridia bacterium]|nr:hypothetical protein [Clostridia bacterium]